MDATTLTQAVATAREFNDDLVRELDAAFGPRPWTEVADSGGRGGCGEGRRREFLPRREFPGVYPAEQLPEVRDLIVRVGRAHGYGDPSLLVERPGYLAISASDSSGSEYNVVVGVKTALVTSTGCHLPG